MNGQSLHLKLPPWPRFWCALAVWAAVLTLGGAASAEPRSIESFVAVQSKWKQYAGTTWTLEGRYALLGPRDLRFQNCDMKFRLNDDFARVRGLSNVIEVTGTIERDNDEVYFRVTSLRTRPSDQETLRLRRSTIDTADPKAWYDLADWARSRGRFYSDEGLLADALALYQEGIDAERRRLNADDAEGRQTLARKAQELGLPESFVLQLEHEALRVQFGLLRKLDKSDFSLLTTQIARRLPGSLERLEASHDELSRKYAADPLGSYRLAAEQERRILNRLFHLEVLRARIEQIASPDGRNGYDVARQIELQAPELEQLADQYRQKQLEYQLERVATLTRQELLEFAQRCEARENHALALKGKEGWLAAREPRLREDGARGLVELGEDWMSLVGDESRAAKYFIDAFNANPDYPPAAEWLTTHGYVYQRGKWLLATAAEKTTDPKELAVREGRVEVGMTTTEVRAALGAGPSATYRFASSGFISDLWIFDQAGILVRFEHRPGRASGGVVVAIEELDRGSGKVRSRGARIGR